MQTKIEQYVAQIKQMLASEQLVLPSLPDIALQVNAACSEEGSSAQLIADIVMQDPALSVRLLQVANSSLYRTRNAADNIQMAITRLGLKLVKDLIMALAMKQLYQPSTDILQERFREIWLSSVKTAAMSRMLTSQQTQLDSEQAMLAGLTHNIGALPILLLAEDDDELCEDPEALKQIISQTQGDVGVSIFRAWHFPGYMLDVVRQCYQFDRVHEGDADYVDVVQVALVECSIYTGLDCPDDWSTI
ncbi:MAG: HDOD domain-containing protein, partial [Gammaproteobacteria bacterium]